MVPSLAKKFCQCCIFCKNISSSNIIKFDIMNPLTVLITGTNKGIGCELVKVFVKRNPQATIIATSREPPNIAENRWKEWDVNSRIKNYQLDLNSQESINQFIDNLSKNGIKIDILVNNAGVCRVKELQKKLPSFDWAQQCLRVNVIRQIQLTQKLLPFMLNSCKIVNVCSTVGALKNQPQQAQIKFSNPNITRQAIFQAVDLYIQEVKNQKIVNLSPNVYGTSKMLLAAWSRFVLRKMLKQNQISICVSPGLCLTEMTEGMKEQIKAKVHTSQSGALKIYETIFLPQLSSEVFYHRSRASNYYLNGEGLPRE